MKYLLLAALITFAAGQTDAQTPCTDEGAAYDVGTCEPKFCLNGQIITAGVQCPRDQGITCTGQWVKPSPSACCDLCIVIPETHEPSRRPTTLKPTAAPRQSGEVCVVFPEVYACAAGLKCKCSGPNGQCVANGVSLCLPDAATSSSAVHSETPASQGVIVPAAASGAVTPGGGHSAFPQNILPQTDTICGGKADHLCEGLFMNQCEAAECCIWGIEEMMPRCFGVEDILPLEYGPECGDLYITACEQTPGCLWLVYEEECDELKEMDCQDFKSKTDCDRTVTCNWVFDEVKFVCLETKEVEFGSMLPMPFPGVATPGNSGYPYNQNGVSPPYHYPSSAGRPGQLREANPNQTEVFQWDPVYGYSLAGGFFAGVCFGTFLYIVFWKKTRDDTSWTHSYDIMLDVTPANV